MLSSSDALLPPPPPALLVILILLFVLGGRIIALIGRGTLPDGDAGGELAIALDKSLLRQNAVMMAVVDGDARSIAYVVGDTSCANRIQAEPEGPDCLQISKW